MDSTIVSAARALAVGDPLGALKRVGLRGDPPALALRGIAMARLGEHPRARELLRKAARGFGPREPLARARCVVAEVEVALALRDLGGSPRMMAAAAATLEARADRTNALHAHLVAVRRLLLLGRLDDAAAALARRDASAFPPPLLAVVVLVAPIDGDQASLLALLGDGAAWSTSALALALATSQRTVQRALVALEAAGRVRSIGRARARRWLSPSLAGFTPLLLLPAALPPR